MMRRKGELSPTRVDREWPHQIMLPADQVNGPHYDVIHSFCADLSFCPRGRSIVKDDTWHHVFCFREKTDAVQFHARFGGEWFEPSLRSKGSGWMKLKPPKQRYY